MATARRPASREGGEKEKVLLHLFEAKRASGSMIVTSAEIRHAIVSTGADLGMANQANFLKDIIRRQGASHMWPRALRDARITARQRFGQKRVFEFIPFLPNQTEAFPDRFEPDLNTQTFDIQSLSLPFAARRLGRPDETWLAQVVVNLRIVESQLAFCSSLSKRLREISHLQIGMKTQPEIDATYLVTAWPLSRDYTGDEEHLFVTCEVKRGSERLLEDQIRFQIHQGFKTTAKLKKPPINGVKPIAIKIVERMHEGESEKLIYVVELETIARSDYAEKWAPITGSRKLQIVQDDTPVYDIPLAKASDGLFRIRPSVEGIM